MSLISALTAHVATAGALAGAAMTVLALSGVAVLWSRSEKHAVARIDRSRPPHKT